MRLIALDLVRFFAAFAVVMYHYTARNDLSTFPLLAEVTKFGYLGVPLFFIISGYVISLSAHNRSPIEFAVSRFVRLYPVFWVGIFITCVVTVLLDVRDYSAAQILANMTMLHDYMGFQYVDGVYWTLQAELKFYACIFLLLLLGVFDKFRMWLSIWLALTLLHLLTNQPFFMGWFISPGYSSFFIAGVAFYLIHKEGVNLYNSFVMSLSLIISGVRGWRQATGFIENPGMIDQSVVVIVILSFYVLFYLLVTDRIKLAGKKFYLTLGGLTYPLYLIHNVAGKAIIDEYKDVVSEWVMVVCVTVLVIFLSYLVHVYIEKRISSPLKTGLLMLIKKWYPKMRQSLK